MLASLVSFHMQELIHELVRWFGYAALRLMTGARYAGGTSGDELREGAFGLVLIALITYVAISIST